MVAEKLEAKDEILLNYPKEVSLAPLILFGTLGVEAPQKVGWILLFLTVGARAIVWIAKPAATAGTAAASALDHESTS